MTKAPITEADKETLEQWVADAKNVTKDTLPGFIDKVMNGYEHDYGTVCHAIAACAVATAWACNREEGACGGITGFQAGAVGWRFLKGWGSPEVGETGSRLLNYDNVMFPQYDYMFQPTIPKAVWELLQEKAKKEIEKLDDELQAHPVVLERWRTIAAGVVPAGFEVQPEE